MSSVKDFLKSIGAVSRSSRNVTPTHNVNRPTEKDLALQTLKRKYRDFLESDEKGDRDSKLLQLIPLFNKCCGKIETSKLEDSFSEIFDFAENVAFLFVRHVTQLAQSNSATLFEYFEGKDDAPGAGKILLKGVSLCNANVTLIEIILCNYTM